MDLSILEGIKQEAEAVLKAIVDHLNGEFDFRSVMKVKSILGNEYQTDLEELASQKKKIGAHLQEYAWTWLSVESSFSRWASAYPLYSRMQECLRGVDLLVLPDRTRGASLFVSTSRNSSIKPGEREAAWLFAQYITSPFSDRIGQCPQCSRYFFSIGGKEKKYCSRVCATGFTARQAVKAKRAEDQQEKLFRAQAAIKKYESQAERDEDWKGWVAKKAKVSRRWITMAVERGDLVLAKDQGGNHDL